ncbi:distal membrane-arm assembly complex protein 2 isoform X6 [Rattus norvegicus]|uniref:distal membrane-arm assembly complex protein 2 isoform X6 n=1 Tax=Rattus norvegicus TaxID=10116 RepID=UPI0019174DBA|nr:distal membrane-arm assembly complex protein 2 isoform X4 [Rattus norvegicus]
MAAPRAFLHLGAREWHGRARGTHSMSGLATPDSNREKKRTLLQFLSDHFHDVQTLREYLLQKQISKVSMENRSYRKIQERYGPYITGAQFILKQGGAVKSWLAVSLARLASSGFSERSCFKTQWEST